MSYFCFTVNNKTAVEVQAEIVRWYRPQYYILANEIAPTTRTPHCQGYAEFSRRVKIDSFAKRLWNCHVELRRGSQEEAIRYCRKEDEHPLEGGTPVVSNQGSRSDLTTLAHLVRDGAKMIDLFNRFPSQFMMLQRKILDLRNFLRCPPHLESPPEVILYRGPPGSGKSTAIEREIGTDEWFTPCQDVGDGKLWFDWYEYQPIIWLRDFKTCPISLFKNLCDKWTVTLPVKCGSIKARPTKIFICSNSDPHEWWHALKQDELLAVERRITRWMVPGPNPYEFVAKSE